MYGWFQTHSIGMVLFLAVEYDHDQHFHRESGYTNQRKYAPWIGGSLLGSFDTYHKSMKITRQEWEENGEVVLDIKNF